MGQQIVEEPFEQRGLAHAAGAGNQTQLAAFDQVIQSRQPALLTSLLKALATTAPFPAMY